MKPPDHGLKPRIPGIRDPGNPENPEISLRDVDAAGDIPAEGGSIEDRMRVVGQLPSFDTNPPHV